jgi:hypothetical protein
MKRNNTSLFNYIVVVIGFLSVVIAFLPAIMYSDSETVFKGYELIIGTQFLNLGSIASGQIEPNIIIGIGYILPIVACLLLVFSKKSALISLVLFIVSIGLLFLTPEFVVTSVTVVGVTNIIDVQWSMAYGLYVAIGLSFLGALFSIYPIASRSFQD